MNTKNVVISSAVALGLGLTGIAFAAPATITCPSQSAMQSALNRIIATPQSFYIFKNIWHIGGSNLRNSELNTFVNTYGKTGGISLNLNSEKKLTPTKDMKVATDGIGGQIPARDGHKKVTYCSYTLNVPGEIVITNDF